MNSRQIGEITFLSVQDVIDLHSDLIDFNTPDEPKDVLDAGRLEAAVMTPQQTFDGEYLYQTISEMAAAYLLGLAAGHAFRQGNKRIAFVACGVFLKQNGLRLTLSQAEAVQLTLDVVNHDIDREQLAITIANHVVDDD